MIEPDLTRFGEHSDLLVVLDCFFELLLLVLRGDKDDLLQVLDEVGLEVELVGDELDGGVVDIVGVVVVEEEQKKAEDIVSAFKWLLDHLVHQQLLQLLLLGLLRREGLLVLDHLSQEQLQPILYEESVEQRN